MMKKYLRLFSLLFAMLTVTGCEDPDGDVIWDIAPFELSLQVVDSMGNTLLDPAGENNILDQVTATYEGRTYALDYSWFQERSSTRSKMRRKMYLARFKGLYLEPFYSNHGEISGYKLKFGEFQGENDVINKDVVIDWGDGTSDTFNLNHTFKWKHGKPHSVNHIYRNGQEMRVPEDFIIVK